MDEGATFQNLEAELAPLERFHKEAFLPSTRSERDEYGFFLALATIYNDLKDFMLCNALLGALPEHESSQSTPQVGEHHGIHNHLYRALFATIYELLELVRKHNAVIVGELFQKVLRVCPRKPRSDWKQIVKVAGEEPISTPFAHSLVQIRNTISYHYDVKVLVRGYESAFNNPQYGTPRVSRGNNMQQSRFYFADAATQAYFTDVASGNDIPDDMWIDLVRNVNEALYQLVSHFIGVRVGHFEKEE